MRSRDAEDHSDHNKKIQTFVNNTLIRILGILWPEIIVMNGFANAHVKCRWNKRSDRDAGDKLVTLSAKQSPALHDKP